MKRNLLLLAAAAGLALTTACNQDKPAAVDAATTPSADTAVVVKNETVADTTVLPAVYQDRAYRAADQVASDLSLTTDTVKVRRLRTTYYTRAQRLADLDDATDTAGRATAVSQINTDTDTEVRSIVGDDAKYRTYETNRTRYYGDGYVTETTTTTTETARPRRHYGPRIVKYERSKGGDVKIVYSNGTTVKIDKDGDRKIEYANGTKVKRDADDGEVKVKN